MARQLVIVRHGETEWSRDGRHTGLTDIPLTAMGRRQAEDLRGLLAGHDFEAVLTSPLERARESCALAGFGDRAVVDPDLVEWDYGSYDGLTTVQIHERRPGWSLFRDGPPDGEQLEHVAGRAERVIARADAYTGAVIVFAHGHLLRVLLARWCELPAASGQRFALHAACPSVLGREHDWHAVLSFNALPLR